MTNKQYTTTFFKHEVHFSARRAALFVLAFALIGFYVVWRAFASGPTVAKLEAERMTLPTGARIVTDSSASGGQAVKFATSGQSGGQVALPASATSFTVTAKASSCRRSWPTMTLSIDGKTLLTSNVRRTSWGSYSVTTGVANGTRNVTIRSNNYTRNHCTSALYVDVVTFYGSTVPTPAPALSLSASPTSLTAGGSATLTWNSTNATSCTASGAWSGAEPISGNLGTGALNQTNTYTLKCTGSGGTTTASVTVTVNPVAAPSPAPTTPKSGKIGVYVGAANPAGVAAFASWLGKPVNYAEDFIPGDNWSSIESPMWWLNAWSGKGYQMVYGVPIIPDTGGSLSEGASGAYNDHFRKLAQNLVATGQGDATLRLGWEFGGGWYHWAIKNAADAANYAAYWRQTVTTMRSVAPNLKFDWNPIWGWQSVDPTLAYPGDNYVDTVGLDVYDQSWVQNYQDPAARWNDALSAPWGLNWQRDFASTHKKSMSFPEWGVAIRDDGHGGGDNPAFIQQMASWISQNNVTYYSYFEFDAPDGKHSLTDGNFPKAAAIFKQLFGS